MMHAYGRDELGNMDEEYLKVEVRLRRRIITRPKCIYGRCLHDSEY